MTGRPQSSQIRKSPVDEWVAVSTPCASPKMPLTWDDAVFSTIHTPYYSYS